MKLSEKGPITQVRLLLDGKHGIETVRVNDEVAHLEEELDDERGLRYETQNKTSKRIMELEAENAALKRELMSLKAAYYRANNRQWQAEDEIKKIEINTDAYADENAELLKALEEIAEIAHRGANGDRTHGSPATTLRHIRDLAKAKENDSED